MTSIPLLVKTSECKQFRSTYLKNKTIFPQFFSSFFESALNLEPFERKMTLIAYAFPKLPTTNDLLREMSKNSHLGYPLDRWHGKPSETLIQS